VAPRRRNQQVTEEADDSALPSDDVVDAAASPIEVLLGTMRALWQASRDAAGSVVDAKTAAAAAGLAKDAAPYVHPRLATIEPPERDLSLLSDAALEERIRALLQQECEES
jgi:hypothetical protein